MLDNEKGALLAALNEAALIPGMRVTRDDVKAAFITYWGALGQYSLDEVRAAIAAHLRDSDRGRWFPKPADIIDKIPARTSAWMSADEAWARCPKSESASAAMTREMSEALAVCQDMIDSGDMIAARMAFRAAYNRLVDLARGEGRGPVFYPSLGADSASRHDAIVLSVSLNNALLPPERRRALPPPDSVPALPAPERRGDAAGAIDYMRKMLGRAAMHGAWAKIAKK